MEVKICYTDTKDGVEIAYWTLGQGRAFIHLSTTPSLFHYRLERQIPGWQHWVERLAQHAMVIGYDGRGSGLSGGRADYSLDTLMLDLDAVIDAAVPNQGVLFGQLRSGPLAVAYAGLHPNKVSHVILWCSWLRQSEVMDSGRSKALRGLIVSDWPFFTGTLTQPIYGRASADSLLVAELVKDHTKPSSWNEALLAAEAYDISKYITGLKAPLLIMHRLDCELIPITAARRLHESMPSSNLVIVPGNTALPFTEDSETVLQSIGEFLGEEWSPSGTFRTLLFTDLVDHTEMMRRLGDERGRLVLREHEKMTRDLLKRHGGFEFKAVGDGFMAWFLSVTKAVDCAISLQRAFAERNLKAEEPMHIRVGLNAGEPIEEGGDFYGESVILASRLVAVADGDEIVVPNVVRELCAGKGYVFRARGEESIQGFDEPVTTYLIEWRD